MLKTTLLAGTALLAFAPAHAQVASQGVVPGVVHAPVAPTTPGAEAAWGDLAPFWGDLDPFWGDLDPFWGDLEPFWGDLEPFWGDLEGFWGDLEGFDGATAAWGDLEGFWGDLEGFWGDLEGFWNPEDETVWSPAQGRAVEARFAQMLAEAEAVFGPAVEARSGQSFNEALTAPLLARYGVGTDLTGLAELAPRARARLFLDLYDSLMDHSGRDRVDWWMGAVAWSPALAQDHDAGRATVGVLDTRIGRTAQAGRRVRYRAGYRMGDLDGRRHGEAVSSLIAAPHDGVGVMGVAPKARLLNFNPFDESATAGWYDVERGIAKLRRRGAHVINASLGVDTRVLSPEWADVLGRTLDGDDVVVVKAAGNAGVDGQDSFWWNAGAADGLILVGSVNLEGRISAFSNRPGEGCIVSFAGCAEGDRLMDRFVVAPGEMILVDDGTGTGGTLRASGTSFAAPLVTGTVALMHGRWPWLERHAAATSEIILDSARDLGAPGVDPVYGRGLLDVEAALSPLDFGALYQIKGRGKRQRRIPLGDALLSEGGLRGFARRGVLVAFEDAGDTYRDFVIPLSERTVDGRTRVAGRRRQDNQSHLFGRLADWTADANGLTDAVTGTAERRGYTLQFTQAVTAEGRVTGETVYRFDGGASVTLGQGQGLPTSLMFDRQADAGGARLSGTAGLLGFAQGGAYAGAALPTELGTLSFAVARTDPETQTLGFEHDPVTDQFDQDAYASLGAAVALRRELMGATVNVGYQRLDEANGVLGTQGTGALSLGRGAVTDAVTAEVIMPRVLGAEFGFSATSARTAPGAQSGLIEVGEGGILSTGFAARASMDGLFLRSDRVTLTLSQPLTATGGSLIVGGAQVLDRADGTRVLAPVTIDADSAPMVAEASWTASLGPAATVRALAGHDTATEESQVGLSFGLRF